MNKFQFHIRHHIFPVIKIKLKEPFGKGKEGKVEVLDFDYLGTGFWASLERVNAFITARHVVDIELEDNHYIGYGRIGNESHTFWEEIKFHEKGDLAYKIFSSELPEHAKAFPVYQGDSLLQHGSPVFTYGYPLSVKKQNSDFPLPTIHLKDFYFRGYIASHYQEEELELTDYPFEMNYALSFESVMGLSGAPLLITDEDGIKIAGIIYGNKQVQYILDTWEESAEGENRKIRCRNNKAYYFGLSSTHRDIWGIEAF